MQELLILIVYVCLSCLPQCLHIAILSIGLFVSSTSERANAVNIKQVIDVLIFEKNALLNSLRTSYLGGTGLPINPQLDKDERGLRETELLTFTSLSVNDFHRYQQLQVFNNIASYHQSNAKLINFTGTLLISDGLDYSVLKRRYCRQLSSFAVPQILALERLKDPLVTRTYYPLTDSLLVSMIWPPLDRRIGYAEWNPKHSIRTRVSYKEYRIATDQQVR